MRSFRLRPHHVLPLIALAAACGGNSCSCVEPIPGGFPTSMADRHSNAMQVRLTQPALDYMEQNGTAIISKVLPGGSKFEVPSSCGDTSICCMTKCELSIDIKNLVLDPIAPSTLRFIATAALDNTPSPIKFASNLLPNNTCKITLNTAKGKNAQAIDLAGGLAFKVDPDTHLTSLSLGDVAINNLEPEMITIEPWGSGIFDDLGCRAADFLKGTLVDTLKNTLKDEISKAANEAFCVECKQVSDCPKFADACSMDGQCMRGGECLQEVGISGRLGVGELFGDIAKGSTAAMDILAVLGGYAEAKASPTGGMSLGMIGGGMGAPHNPCVPVREPPPPVNAPVWAEASANVEPITNKPYHVGIGVHSSHLAQLLWAAYDGGALCLNIGTATVAQLDGKTLGVIMPSLSDLTHGGNPPMVLALRPTEVPVITLGLGTFEDDGMGGKKIKDPLLNVSLPKVNVDFYAFLDDRFVRVLTLTADVALPVSLDVDDKNELVPLIGDLTKAFTNVKVTNSELLSEDPARLAAAFPTLLGLAGSALGSLNGIALPDVMGLKIKPVAIGSTEDKAFLSIFAELDLSSPSRFHARTDAHVTRVIQPDTAAFRAAEGGLDEAKRPVVEIAVDGEGRLGRADDLEWSVRIDTGSWRPYSSARLQRVSDPLLWLQGRHTITVRARVVGEPSTTDPEPQVLPFLVDTIAPTGTFDAAGDEIVIAGEDAVSPADALRYSVRVDGGAWSEWTQSPRVAVRGAATRASVIDVRIADEMGNVGPAFFHGRTTNPDSGGGCSCSTGGAEPAGTPLAFLLGGALVLLALRVRRTAAIGLVLGLGLGLGLGGCNNDNMGGEDAGTVDDKGAQLDPLHSVGRYLDAVAAGGRIHLAAYDETTGDLAYATVSTSAIAEPPVWRWVDGVPLQIEPDDPGGYRRGTTEEGDDVGANASIAVDSAGRPSIAYQDIDHHSLKYAYLDGSEWKVGVVEGPPIGADAKSGPHLGVAISLSLDSAGVPSIAYMASQLPDGKGGHLSKLKVATAKSTTPSGTSDWTVVDVDSTAIPCAGLCAAGEACVPTGENDADPSKSACERTTADCGGNCGDDEACFVGVCTTVLPPPKTTDLPEGTGLFVSLRRLAGGARVVVYHDRTQGDLKLATSNGASFNKPVFVDGNSPDTDVGQFAATAVGADGTVHVAYVDANGDRLLYRTVKDGTPAMAAEVIDDGLRDDGPHPVGAGAAILVDGAAIQVVYQDQRTADLQRAVRAGGKWTRGTLHTGAPGYGFWPRLVSDGGKAYVAHYVYDRMRQSTGGALGAVAISAVQ